MAQSDRTIRRGLGLLAGFSLAIFLAHVALQRYTLACEKTSADFAEPAHVFVGTDGSGMASAELFAWPFSQGLEAALAAEIMGVSSPPRAFSDSRADTQPHIPQTRISSQQRSASAEQSHEVDHRAELPTQASFGPTYLPPAVTAPAIAPHEPAAANLVNASPDQSVDLGFGIRPSFQLWVAEHGFNIFITSGASIILGQPATKQLSFPHDHWIHTAFPYSW